MMTKEQLRSLLCERLDRTIYGLNRALQGENSKQLELILSYIGRGGQLPHWYAQLRDQKTLPNLDGKTVGSVLEMLLVGVLETITFQGFETPPLRINPARGVDLPDLDLNVKSPSENYCTSEPFFSAYERLLGSEYDTLIMLTDYQTAKRIQPLKLQIIKWRYLYKTQLADSTLCTIAQKHREWLLKENEVWAKKVFRFLAYINQSDWRAKHLLLLMDGIREGSQIQKLLTEAEKDFERKNARRARANQEALPDDDLECLLSITAVQPLFLGVIDAADNWVIETHKDAARLPNDNEWNRLLTSPLDGQIGMSFALQWRYNFSKVFRS